MGYSYEFYEFGSMLVGIDMEGSDRDVNVQATQCLPIAVPEWMKKVACALKAMGSAAGVTDVRECDFKDIAVCLL